MEHINETNLHSLADRLKELGAKDARLAERAKMAIGAYLKGFEDGHESARLEARRKWALYAGGKRVWDVQTTGDAQSAIRAAEAWITGEEA